jgi:ribosomal protein S18 acetylase RimI-like enzyme
MFAGGVGPEAVPNTEPIGTVWGLSLAGPPRPVEAPLLATFDRLPPEAAPELAPAISLAEAQQRLQAGRHCYVARVSGKLAAYGWVSFVDESIGELGLRISLQPDEAYIWDCATLPVYRRQGLYSALLEHIVQALRAQGLRTAWIGADYNNSSSNAGIARAGFTPLATIVAQPPAPGESRRRARLATWPSVGPERVRQVQRVYMGGCEEVWLFDERPA